VIDPAEGVKAPPDRLGQFPLELIAVALQSFADDRPQLGLHRTAVQSLGMTSLFRKPSAARKNLKQLAGCTTKWCIQQVECDSLGCGWLTTRHAASGSLSFQMLPSFTGCTTKPQPIGSLAISQTFGHCWRSRRTMPRLIYEKPKVDYGSESNSCKSSSALREATVAIPMIVLSSKLSYQSDLMREPCA
jgi:hypothetical protein